jgi:hypothetical protein
MLTYADACRCERDGADAANACPYACASCTLRMKAHYLYVSAAASERSVCECVEDGEVCCARAYVRCASAMYASAMYASAMCMCRHTSIHVLAYLYICVRIPLYMCPHTSICVRIPYIRRGLLRARLRQVCILARK